MALWLLAAFLLFSGADDSGAVFILHRQAVRNASARSAVCNDHTQAIFYIDNTTSNASTRWLIFLEGGGLCSSPGDCMARYVQQRYHFSSDVPQYQEELEGEKRLSRPETGSPGRFWESTPGNGVSARARMCV